MPYKMILKLKNNKTIESPSFIVPNNPKHGLNHFSIVREINKTGNSMVKRLPDVIGYSPKKYLHGGVQSPA